MKPVADSTQSPLCNRRCFTDFSRGVQVKLWDPLRTRAIPERLRGAFTTRRYTNRRLPLPLPSHRYNKDSGFGSRTTLSSKPQFCLCSVSLSLLPNFPSMLFPSPLLDNIRVMVIVWRLRWNIIRTAPCLLSAALCDTMFTVSSTLIWTVLTGPADWVCHIGTLTPCIEAVA